MYNTIMNHFHPIPNPNPNPNPYPNPYTTPIDHLNLDVYETFDISEFENIEPSDFLVVEDGSEEDLSSQIIASSEETVEKSEGQSGTLKVAFRTKSELEIMDDGFKWRKYGKKMVKTSPNPRNYYKCSSKGCKVKKRVERDSKDPSYVITTYDGIHNHESPCLVYSNYNQTQDLIAPAAHTLTFNTSSPHSSST